VKAKTMATQAQIQRQPAKAKTQYLDLCTAIEACQDVLCGRLRGSKERWVILEKMMQRGKSTFIGVADLKDLVSSVDEA
jgi:hypothetical protein